MNTRSRMSKARAAGVSARGAVAAATIAAGAAWTTQAVAVAPEVERWESTADVPVYFVRAPEIPMIDVRIVFDAGSTRDGDHPGLAELVARTLDDATESRDSGDLARHLEDTGARLSVSASRESAAINLRTLTDEAVRDQAIETFIEVLREPAFREDALQRELGRMRQGLQAQKQSASARAERALYEAMYGDHPYGSPPDGTPESLEALAGDAGREQVVDFHGRYYVAANAAVAIVGDVERSEAEAIAERVLDALPTGEKADPLPEVDKEPERHEVRINMDSAQTAILMGTPMLARGEDGEYPMRIVDQAFGGSGLVSRLHQAMREDRGLSYSTSAGLRLGSIRSPWVVRTTVSAERTEEALTVLEDEVRKLVADGLTDDEIEASQRHLTGAFPLALSSNAALIGQLSVLARHGLPPDHLDQYVPRIEAVDSDAIRQTLQSRIDPDRMVRVLVGPGVEDDG